MAGAVPLATQEEADNALDRSLCTDQANVKERNSQVRYMWAIYRHALETTVFLGEETEFTERGMRWVEAVAKFLKENLTKSSADILMESHSN